MFIVSSSGKPTKMKTDKFDTVVFVIKTIKEKSIQDGIEIMKNQGHSGMSWGLMKSMVREFCDCGNEFLEQLGE